MSDARTVRTKYFVQFTETAGGTWQDGQYFVTEATARLHAQHMVDGLQKVSARVLHEVAIYSRKED